MQTLSTLSLEKGSADQQAGGAEEEDEEPRHLTDCQFPKPIFLIVAITTAALIFVWALMTGDLDGYRGLEDSEDRRCGVAGPMQDRNFLYECNQTHWVCVQNCSNATREPAAQGCKPNPARGVYNQLCLPTKRSDAWRVARKVAVKAPGRYILMTATDAATWVPVGAALLVSLLLPICLVICLSKFLEDVIRAVFLYAAAVSLIVGLCKVMEGGLINMLCALVSFAITIALASVYCWYSEAIDVAARCFETAAALIKQSHGYFALLTIAPVAMLVWIALWWYGTAHLGEVQLEGELPTWLALFVTAFNAVVGAWGCEFILALVAFSCSYTVEEYFTKDLRRRSYLLRRGSRKGASPQGVVGMHQAPGHGLYVALRYHLVTISLGSLYKVVLWIPMMVGIISHSIQDIPFIGKDMRVMCCGCRWVRLCHDRLKGLRGFNVYIGVAVDRDDFWDAATETQELMEAADSRSVKVLDQVVWGLGAVLVAITATAGAGVAFAICTFAPAFSDPDSKLFVADAVGHAALAWVLSLLVTAPMMVTIGHTALTSLWCEARFSATTKPQSVPNEEQDGDPSIASPGCLWACASRATPQGRSTTDTVRLVTKVPGVLGGGGALPPLR